MSDIMFNNNNNEAIKKLAKNSYRNNKLRNIVAIIAVILTTNLICSIFSIGGSYISSYQLYHQQLLGTTGQATLNSPSETQFEILRKSSNVAIVGIRADVILPSFVNAGVEVENTNLYYGFRYFSIDEWTNHRYPTINNVIGYYPEQSDEIMIPLWVLNKMGIIDPQIGMELSFVYEDSISQLTKEKQFVLSGWFDEYDYVKDGAIAFLLVSEMFCKNEQINFWDNKNTIVDITFTSTDDLELISSILEQELELSPYQILSINPEILDGSNGFNVIGICLALSIAIMLSGYLLIYNVFYISISNDVRFYGQLRTIGTTSKQIRRIVFQQAGKIAFIGIVCGLVVSASLSYLLVPVILRTLTEASSGITIMYHPIIYIGAASFSFVTVTISVLKPAKIAENISPFGAYRYTEINDIKMNFSTKRKFSLSHMALKNLWRSKAKSILVILSIFLGVTSCMIVTALVSSMSTDNFVNTTLQTDIKLTNQTLSLGYDGEQKQVFNEDFFTKLSAINGITNVIVQKEQTIIPKYSADMFYPYIKDKYAKKGITPPNEDYYIDYPNLFYTQLIGVEADNLKDVFVENGWDLEAFRNGEFALLVSNNPELFPSDMIIEFDCGNIQQYKAISDGVSGYIKIGGFLPTTYYGGLTTDAPYVYISNQAIEAIAPNAYNSVIGIDIIPSDTTTVISSIKELCANLDVSMVSRSELSKGLKDAKITLYVLGGGIAIVLAFIGIMNFVNMMFTNITVRKYELSMMESIGMTKKQCCRMLQMEGTWYAFISIGFILIVGNACLWLAYQVFKDAVDYASFAYPAIPSFILIVSLFVICWSFPAYFMNKIMQEPVVERLRES